MNQQIGSGEQQNVFLLMFYSVFSFRNIVNQDHDFHLPITRKGNAHAK